MNRARLAFRLAFILAVVGLPLLFSVAARADDDAATDLAFWQSIQNSSDPAEYQAYLDAFPHGKFAKLALIRAHPTAPAAAAAAVAIPLPALRPAPQPAPPAQPATDDAGDTPAGKMVLEPAAPRVGQTIRITCEDFPKPTSADMLVVVPAGSPVMDPARGPDQTKAVWFAYALNCFSIPVTAGPFAPGAYEVRFMTRLYNNTGVMELHATTGFRVR
jgi:hypothetical protein